MLPADPFGVRFICVLLPRESFLAVAVGLAGLGRCLLILDATTGGTRLCLCVKKKRPEGRGLVFYYFFFYLTRGH